MKSFIIDPTAIIRGVGMTLGTEVVDVEGITVYYNSNLNNKAKKDIELID